MTWTDNDWRSWSQTYAPWGAYAVGYAQGVEEARGGPCEVTPPAYVGDPDFTDGYHLGLRDGAPGGSIQEANALMFARPLSPADAERSRREHESEENQQIMWDDGSVSTRSEHEAREIRENLERMTENHIGDLPPE